MKRIGLRLTTGIALFFAGIAFLCTSYQDLFQHGIWVIDTELNESGKNSLFMRTRVDFGKGTYMESLPNQVDDWYGAGDYDWEYIKKALNADAMLVRAYTKPSVYQLVFFLLAQSDDPSSFHPPPVCFRAQGYEIEQESKISFIVPNTEWAARYWRSEAEGNIFKGSLDAKMLVIVKKDADGNIFERMVVLYYYVKHGGVVPDNITMVQVSAFAPNEGSYEITRDLLEELMGDMVPVLFEPEKINEESTAIHFISEFGFFGYLIIAGIILVPFAIAFLPIGKLRIRRHKEPPSTATL